MDIQTLANLAVFLGLLLTLLEIIDTWLDIRKKLVELLEKRQSIKPGA
jgi:hypothetical protein